MMELKARRLLKYLLPTGRCPFDDWFSSLKDKRTKAIIATRLNRLVQGNFGSCRRLGSDFWELKIDFGPGFRIYFGEEGKSLVVLLCGGDKSTQPRDIEKAIEFWTEYKKE